MFEADLKSQITLNVLSFCVSKKTPKILCLFEDQMTSRFIHTQYNEKNTQATPSHFKSQWQFSKYMTTIAQFIDVKNTDFLNHTMSCRLHNILRGHI